MSDLCKYQLISPVAAGEGEDLLVGKTSEDGLRRIQSLLAEWIRMENVVVLTAAGCSVKAGGRLMAGPKKDNLECLVLDAVEKCALSDDVKAIIEWKKSGWPEEDVKGPSDFETWLSCLFNASSLTEKQSSPIHSVFWKKRADDGNQVSVSLDDEDETKLRRLIEKAIFAECALEFDRKELSGDGKPSSGHVPFLAKLIARDASLGRTHLFTLNYDTLFEQAMEELGIQYFDGFSGKASARFDPSVYGLDIYYPGDVAEGRVRRFDKFLKFYKLHGSIHWYKDVEGTHHARHRDLSFASAYRAADPDEKAVMLASREFEGIPEFGILPTSQKSSLITGRA